MSQSISLKNIGRFVGITLAFMAFLFVYAPRADATNYSDPNVSFLPYGDAYCVGAETMASVSVENNEDYVIAIVEPTTRSVEGGDSVVIEVLASSSSSTINFVYTYHLGYETGTLTVPVEIPGKPCAVVPPSTVAPPATLPPQISDAPVTTINTNPYVGTVPTVVADMPPVTTVKEKTTPTELAMTGPNELSFPLVLIGLGLLALGSAIFIIKGAKSSSNSSS